MPIYSYQCGTCAHEFEVRQGYDAAPEHECPNCHNVAKRLFHPVGIIYKGTGFYTTDYQRPRPSPTQGVKEGRDKPADPSSDPPRADEGAVSD